jgi:hypothetical protein
MNLLGPALDEALDRAPYALFVFSKKRANYISNCELEELIIAMREFIAAMEGRLITPGDTVQ